jgi:tetratricopeptide (TPR) repeat protein
LQVAHGHFELAVIDDDFNEFLAAGREYESLGSDSGSAFAASSYAHAARWREAPWNEVVRVLDPLLEPSHQATPEARLRWQEARGIAHYRLRHFDRAPLDLEPVVAAKYPGSSSERGINAIIAASYVLDKKWAESKSFSEAALARPFSDLERDLESVLLRNASVAYLMGTPAENAKAIAALDRLPGLSPTWPDFPLWIADAYSRAGDKTRAATWYQKMAHGGTAPARAYLSVGATAFCSSQFDVAEAGYRRALDVKGDAAEETLAAIGIADVLYVRGRGVQPLQFNDDLKAADAQYASVNAADEKTRRHIAAMRGHIAYIRLDWDAALAFYGEADTNDATVAKFILEATQAKEHGITKIDDVPPDELGPNC